MCCRFCLPSSNFVILAITDIAKVGLMLLPLKIKWILEIFGNDVHERKI